MQLINKIKGRLAYEYYVRQAYKRSWKSDRKIVVIESDDWGTIRIPNKEAINAIKELGVNTEQCNYMQYDALERKEDLSSLYDVLSSFRDFKGNHPIMTTNVIVGNPDFDKIEKSDFQEYFYEPFTETYKRYYNQDLKIWFEGIESKVVNPQLHGREHLNVLKWLSLLQNGSKEIHLAFKNRFWGIENNISLEKNGTLMGAFDTQYFENSEPFHHKMLLDSIEVFEQIFGYKTKSFIAPNYIWYDSIERVLAENGIRFMQGSLFQILPSNDITNKRVFHYNGEYNQFNQLYLTRNCKFEPSKGGKNWVDLCLKQIQKAFNNKNPAIINSHRVNYMGGISERNRDENLSKLKILIGKLIKIFPDVEFLRTQDLGDLISEN